jgi:hypothetical protein
MGASNDHQMVKFTTSPGRRSSAAPRQRERHRRPAGPVSSTTASGRHPILRKANSLSSGARDQSGPSTSARGSASRGKAARVTEIAASLQPSVSPEIWGTKELALFTASRATRNLRAANAGRVHVGEYAIEMNLDGDYSPKPRVGSGVVGLPEIA